MEPITYSLTDIIVYQGAITKYMTIMHLIDDHDDIQKATKEEIAVYKTRKQ